MGNERNNETEREPIGIFPSWNWLYGAVVAYTAVFIVVLYLFTVTLNFDAR